MRVPSAMRESRITKHPGRKNAPCTVRISSERQREAARRGDREDVVNTMMRMAAMVAVMMTVSARMSMNVTMRERVDGESRGTIARSSARAPPWADSGL